MGSGLGCPVDVSQKRLFQKVKRIKVDRSKLKQEQKHILQRAQAAANRKCAMIEHNKPF